MSSGDGFRGFFQWLTAPAVLAELIALAIVTLLAVAASQALRAWRRRRGAESEPASWQSRLTEGTLITAPILLALIVMLLARAVLSAFGVATAVLDTGLQLTTALVMSSAARMSRSRIPCSARP